MILIGVYIVKGLINHSKHLSILSTLFKLCNKFHFSKIYLTNAVPFEIVRKLNLKSDLCLCESFWVTITAVMILDVPYTSILGFCDTICDQLVADRPDLFLSPVPKARNVLFQLLKRLEKR